MFMLNSGYEYDDNCEVLAVEGQKIIFSFYIEKEEWLALRAEIDHWFSLDENSNKEPS